MHPFVYMSHVTSSVKLTSLLLHHYIFLHTCLMKWLGSPLLTSSIFIIIILCLSLKWSNWTKHLIDDVRFNGSAAYSFHKIYELSVIFIKVLILPDQCGNISMYQVISISYLFPVSNDCQSLLFFILSELE